MSILVMGPLLARISLLFIIPSINPGRNTVEKAKNTLVCAVDKTPCHAAYFDTPATLSASS